MYLRKGCSRGRIATGNGKREAQHDRTRPTHSMDSLDRTTVEGSDSQSHTNVKLRVGNHENQDRARRANTANVAH